jgi:hypothetical protein
LVPEILSLGDGPGSRDCPELWGGPVRNELCPDDGDFARGVDAQADLPSFQAHHGDADVVADEEFLHELSSQHEHLSHPYLSNSVVVPAHPTMNFDGQYVSRVPGGRAH